MSLNRILVIEDNIAEAKLLEMAFSEGMLKEITFIHTGEEALDFLKKQGKYSHASEPHLVILDLNLPRKNGREILKEIRSDAALRRIPVVIMSVSDRQEDIQNAYNLGANGYIRKPSNFDDFIRIGKSIDEFWFNTVILPSEQKFS